MAGKLAAGLELDDRPWKAAIAELDGLLALAPPETSQVFRRDLLGLPDAHLRLLKLTRHLCTAHGTEHHFLLLEPSDCFERILAAFRAKDWEFLRFERELSPQVYNPPEITETMIESGAGVLFHADSLSIGPSESRYFAERVLRCALSGGRTESRPEPCQS